MEISFCNLRSKDVINVCDGKNLGTITDMIIDTCCGRILGIIVPSNKSFLSLFKNNNDIFIPYNRICKIGKDIILVDIIIHNNCNQNIHCLTNNTHNTATNNNKNTENINIQSLLNKTPNNLD